MIRAPCLTLVWLLWNANINSASGQGLLISTQELEYVEQRLLAFRLLVGLSNYLYSGRAEISFKFTRESSHAME